ncbi:hypothetical protein pb186bvf_015101 [Paramecium bursaria]
MNKQNLYQETSDMMDNLRFITQHSQASLNKSTIRLFKQPENLNYSGYHQASEIRQEVKEQLESLQLISSYVKQLQQKPADVNFFLDDTPNEIEEKSQEEIEIIQKGGVLFGTCLRDTWSKGQQFFYIDNGQVVKILNIKNQYAYIEYENQYGILHINDIKVYGSIK